MIIQKRSFLRNNNRDLDALRRDETIRNKYNALIEEKKQFQDKQLEQERKQKQNRELERGFYR
jgi:hypothetical protein